MSRRDSERCWAVIAPKTFKNIYILQQITEESVDGTCDQDDSGSLGCWDGFSHTKKSLKYLFNIHSFQIRALKYDSAQESVRKDSFCVLKNNQNSY